MIERGYDGGKLMDELIKRLRASVDGRYEKCEVCPYEEDYPCCVDCLDKMHKQAADAIEELSKREADMTHNMAALSLKVLRAEEKRPRWIPVTERLPDAGERVLCYCRANIYEVMKMRTDGAWVHNDQVYDSTYMSGFVTHWMPLPQPPKEET